MCTGNMQTVSGMCEPPTGGRYLCRPGENGPHEIYDLGDTIVKMLNQNRIRTYWAGGDLRHPVARECYAKHIGPMPRALTASPTTQRRVDGDQGGRPGQRGNEQPTGARQVP